MLKRYFSLLFFLPSLTFADGFYKVEPGKLHSKGNIITKILPDKDKFNVEMTFDVKKKGYVPVPASLLKGKKVYEFPQEFRTQAGYKMLEAKKTIDIPKAILKFIERKDLDDLKNGYLVEVLPKNKKSKIEIYYHPSLPEVGWKKVKLTFLSSLPVLGGYELKANLVQ